MKQKYQPRIRMFAGPNGSGKSVLKKILRPELLGVYINPDEIEKKVKELGFLDLSEFEVVTSNAEITNHFFESPLLRQQKIATEKLKLNGSKFDFSQVEMNSYLASVMADFIRQNLLQRKISFTFETVMSSADKVDFLKKAGECGYKTYLYFIATDSPEINVSRVRYRVTQGGHDVAKDKIISRYFRSLDLLTCAIKNSWRAYVFDNSGGAEFLLAESKEGKIIEIKSDVVPAWFDRYVIQKITK